MQFARPGVRQLETATEADDQHYLRILHMLRSISGLEFRLYKEQTLRRRIARRMVLLRVDTMADYVRYLQGRSDELRTLQEEAMISVTRFFRDQEFWDSLKTTVLPSLLYGRLPDRPLRL